MGLGAIAQTKDSTLIKRNVDVQKEYTPIIQDAGKINDIPSISDPEIKKIEVNYSPFSQLLFPDSQIKQLESARLTFPDALSQKDGLFRIGMGNRWATLADLMLPLAKSPTQRLDLNLNHQGIFNEKMHHDNQANLIYNHYSNKVDINIQAGYRFEGFKYYGKNELTDSTTYINLQNDSILGRNYLSETGGISKWKIGGGFITKSEAKDHNFKMDLTYDGFAAQKGLKENSIITHLYYDKKIDENTAGIDLQLQNLLYNSANVKYAANQSNYSVFNLNPYFKFDQPKWNLRIGLNATISKNSEGKGFAPTADIVGQATLVEKAIYLYGGITGNYQVNSMNYMSDLNHFMNLNEKIKDTYTPFDIHGGFKLKLLYNTLIDLSMGYRTIKNQYFFVNDSLHNTVTNSSVLANSFNVAYNDAKVLDGAIRFDYNFNQVFTFILDCKFHKWNVENKGVAWQLPKFEFTYGTDMKLTKKTSVNINYYLATGRQYMNAEGQAKDMKSISDLNLGIFYTHSSKVSSFLKINNILNSGYSIWNGYENVGFNALLGLAFSF
jgi:hypothetical protein